MMVLSGPWDLLVVEQDKQGNINLVGIELDAG